jgi:septum formation protein
MVTKLILASSSPRRSELLKQADIPFQVKVSSVEENMNQSLAPSELVQSLALQKANDVYQLEQSSVVLGADTIVAFEDKVLGKPKNASDAKRMLKMLSGSEHAVYTGVAIVSNSETYTFYEKTIVAFWNLSDGDINKYVNSGEPLDKAGAYGIQGLGATLVKRIEGDYFNVVGLPLSRTVRELSRFLDHQ